MFSPFMQMDFTNNVAEVLSTPGDAVERLITSMQKQVDGREEVA